MAKQAVKKTEVAHPESEVATKGVSFTFPEREALGTRIAIIGPSGSGKTTFSHFLAEKCGLPWVSMDKMVHNPGWQPKPYAAYKPLHDAVVAKDNWVIEGAYRATIPERFARAQTVFFFDMNIWACQWRVIKRTWQNRNKERPMAPEGCYDRFNGGLVHLVVVHSLMGWRKRRARYIAFLEQYPHLQVVTVRRWGDLMKLYEAYA